MSDLYSKAGVNISAGDEFSRRSAQLSATTNTNARFITIHDFSNGGFRGPRSWEAHLPQGCSFMTTADGAGTKPVLNDAIKKHAGSAYDLVAMTNGDITRFGGLPQLYINDLKPKTLGEIDSEPFRLMESTVVELVRICNQQAMVAFTGETAEMNVCIGSDNPNPNAPFIWDGVSIGIIHPDKIIYGDRVEPGDLIVALKEDGFRANGISLVRNAFKQRYGPGFYSAAEAYDDIEDAAVPSVLYDNMLAAANGWHNPKLERLFDIRLIAHMTGGGIGKFTELLARNHRTLAATLDNLFDLPPIMRKCADWIGVSARELHKVWNGGQGVILVIARSEADAFVDFAASYGITSQICGEIRESARSKETEVEVISKYNGEKLLFNPSDA